MARPDRDIILNTDPDTAQQMFTALAELSTDFIGICDMQYKPIYLNPAGRRMIGLASLDALCRVEIKDFFFPEDRDFVYQEFFPRVLREGSSQIEIRFRHVKTGEALWMLYNVFTLRDANGKPIAMSTISHDITERKQAEDRLRESEMRLNAFLSNGAVIAWIKDEDGQHIFLSQNYERRFGVSFSDWQGKTDYELWPLAVAEQFRQNDLFVLASCRAIEVVEEAYNTDDGSRSWWLNTKFPFTDAAGRRYVGGVGVDITERKAVEAALKQSEEALHEVDRHKNEFLATLAHELRNPLVPIRNAVHILKLKATHDPALQRARDLIDRQLQHMVRLIDDLLDISRISQGKLELRKARILLAKILEQVVEITRSQLASAGHTLTLALPPEPIYLDADPIRLEQIFLNLLNNACKYTAKGGKIDLTVTREESVVVVSISDTGRGILPEHLQRIFEMFTQLDSSLEHGQNGLGIGLSLVRELVEMHGGTIYAQSEGLGRGSKFTVRLPVIAETVSDAAISREDRDDNLTSGNYRILIVDDNQDSTDSLALLLQLEGYTVELVYDGIEALRMAEWRKPEVILLDLGIPKLNGYEVARQLRLQPWGKSMVLIAHTGWGTKEDIQRSQDAGFDYHLTKPVDPVVLMELLKRVFTINV